VLPTGKWDGPDWLEKIRKHKQFYDTKEREGFDYALSQYQGSYWSDVDRRMYRSNLVSYNLIFAICESAVSNLLPPNMRFAVTEFDTEPQLTIPDSEKQLELMARKARWREEGALALVAAVLYGRFILKVTKPGSVPLIRNIDPRKIFFDMTTPRAWEIRYFIELNLRTPEDLQRADGNTLQLPPEYQGPTGLTKLKQLATTYPLWVSEAANKTAGEYVQTWEIWDNEAQTMSVWIEGCTEPVTVVGPDAYYCPYVLANLNHNGLDCRGLSEVQLVKDLVASINRMLTYSNEIVRRQIPITLYNKSTMSEEEIANAASAAPGDYVGVTMGIGENKNVMIPGPIAGVPPDLIAFQSKLEQIVSYVSALSDSARGQVTGARTATELSLIESQQRNRLKSRTTEFYNAFSKAATLALMLANGIEYDKLSDLEEHVKIVANNAAELNRAVLQEKFQQIYQFCLTRPQAFDIGVLDKLFVEVFQLPPDFLAKAPPPMAMPPGMPGMTGMPPEGAPPAGGAPVPGPVPEEAT